MKGGSGTPSLARGAAIITLATAASRVTGFIRVIVVAAAMGTTFLANTYQTANTAPNVIFELVAAGVLTSIFVPTFVEYLVKGEEKEGWDVANALTSVALVGLIVIGGLLALAAPLIMRVLTIGVNNAALREEEVELGSTFLRLFAPQVIFYGAGMIMTGALHARRRFALAAVAPIFSNLVVIGTYLLYASMRGNRSPSVQGITSGEILVLGIGTTLGVVAMTVVLIPQLVRLGWHFRFRFDPRHPAVKRGARLGVWALGYAGGYQAGLIVVLVLANKVEGGVAVYQWAYTFFYLPHALFAAPIFSVLFTAMSEHVARKEEGQLLVRMRDGLRMLGFVLLPMAAGLVALAQPLSQVTLQYGVMTAAGAELVGRVLLAFAVGLPMYSSFLVFTRGFYALGDTKTPTLVNAGTVVVSSVAGVVLFNALPEGWEVAGLAFGHSLGFALGAIVLGRTFHARVGSTRSAALRTSLMRTTTVSVAALGAMLVVASLMEGASKSAAFTELAAGGLSGAFVYLAAMMFLKAPELKQLRRILPGSS